MGSELGIKDVVTTILKPKKRYDKERRGVKNYKKVKDVAKISTNKLSTFDFFTFISQHVSTLSSVLFR